MTNSKHVPKRRFSGFEDMWNLTTLGEVTKITMGQSPSGETYSNIPTNYILVQGNADIENGWVKPRIWTTQVTKHADKGDIIMSVRAPAGEVGRTNYDIVIGRGVAAIKGNDFIFQLLEKMNLDGYWKSLSSGSTFESINSNDIKNASFKIPNLQEQEKIGNLFQTIDSLITLHQHKLDKLKNLKKSYLAELFPAEGERVPKRRFPGFEGEWERRKVSELFKITRGYVLAATRTESNKSKTTPYPVYSSQTKDKGLMGFYSKYLYEDAITWTTDGANAGEVNFREGKFYCTNVCGVLLSKEVQADPMIAEAINNIAKKYVSYVGNPKLMNNVMADIEISIPQTSSEREKISQFFTDIDKRISLQQEKLDKLKNLKKAYLNELFV